MTKKDYELIAKALKPFVIAEQQGNHPFINDVVVALTVELKDQNSKFDSTKFLKASGRI